MELTMAMTTTTICRTSFTPHRFDDLLLREPDRLPFIIERDHNEALDDDWAWTIGRSLEAMAREPVQPSVEWTCLEAPAQ
jgi:hypothetical protein